MSAVSCKAASLWLPRLATFLLVIVFVALVAAANGMGLAGEVGGVYGAIDRLGPPFGTGIFVAVLGWTELEVASPPALRIVLRLGLWAAASVGLLAAALDRVELRGS